MANWVSRDRGICRMCGIWPRSRFQLTANESPMGNRCTDRSFEARDIAYGSIILPPHAFFYRARKWRKLMFSESLYGPLGLRESRCAAAACVVLGAGIYCGLPSCLLNPRWKSFGQCHFVVLTTLSSCTTRLSRQGSIFAIVFLPVLPRPLPENGLLLLCEGCQ